MLVRWGRTSTITAGIVLAAVAAPKNVKAGIVIEQKVTIGNGTSVAREGGQKLMLQGDKEVLLLNDQQSVVIDADAAKVTTIDRGHKLFRELPFRKVMGTSLDPNRFLYLPFKSTGKFERILGVKCEDYKGVKVRGPLMTSVTACFSTEAQGSKTFAHLMKLVVERLGRKAQGVWLPDGLPLMVEATRATNPSFTFPDVPPKDLLQFKQRIAKIPPQVTRQVVTKLTSEKLTPEAFRVPAGYKRVGPLPD